MAKEETFHRFPMSVGIRISKGGRRQKAQDSRSDIRVSSEDPVSHLVDFPPLPVA